MKMIQCPYCHRKFRGNGLLNNHIERTPDHQIRKMAEEIKNWQPSKHLTIQQQLEEGARKYDKQNKRIN